MLPKSCEVCHDCIRSPQFNYTTYWKRIEHGKEERGVVGLQRGTEPGDAESE